MIKGCIVNLETTPPDTRYVSDMNGMSRQIVVARGRTLLTFAVSEVDGDIRGIDFANTKWALVPIGGVIAESNAGFVEVPELTPEILSSPSGEEAGTW